MCFFPFNSSSKLLPALFVSILILVWSKILSTHPIQIDIPRCLDVITFVFTDTTPLVWMPQLMQMETHEYICYHIASGLWL
ncbi:hypothetical protein ACJX0J_012195, partial [Zea mays]